MDADTLRARGLEAERAEDFAEAERLLVAAIQEYQRVHRDIRPVLADLERVLAAAEPDRVGPLEALLVAADEAADRGDAEAADGLRARALALAEEALAAARASGDQASALSSAADLGDLQITLGRAADAVDLLQPLCVSSDWSPERLEAQTLLGMAYAESEQLEEAESQLGEVLRQMESWLGPAHPALEAALRNLAQVVRARGRDEEAGTLERRADGLRRPLSGARRT